MHAPLPFQITVRHFGVWRAGCGLMIVLAAVVMALWAPAALGAFPWWLLLSVVLWAVSSVGLAAHVWRLSPLSLRWDGQAWWLGPAATAGQEPMVGHLGVALDLGVWMLLRFAAADPRRRIWLPVQRRGHEHAWHALRATVYCARPVSVPLAAPF